MIEEIKDYYDEKKISPLNFDCKHYPSCVSRAEDKMKFTKGHGIWVGAEYEEGTVPRLLFLSLDSGSAEPDPNQRTMEAAMEWNLRWLPGKGDKPKHWYRTQQFAWHIFNEINKAFGIDLDIGRVDDNFDFNPVTEVHKIKPFYAAANSAKCCMNNERRSQADGKLFENCRVYVQGELSLLDPDIIVTQGKYARKVVEGMKTERIVQRRNISWASTRENDYHVIEMMNGKVILWIHHYHPNNYGTFKKNRDKYGVYAKKAVRFIKEFHSRSFFSNRNTEI